MFLEMLTILMFFWIRPRNISIKLMISDRTIVDITLLKAVTIYNKYKNNFKRLKAKKKKEKNI